MKTNISLKHKMANLSELPKDVIMGIPVLTLLGNKEINIENYGGIIEYTNHLIRIRTKAGQIIISGHNLYIDYYTNNDMKIIGNIISIEYNH